MIEIAVQVFWIWSAVLFAWVLIDWVQVIAFYVPYRRRQRHHDEICRKLGIAFGHSTKAIVSFGISTAEAEESLRKFGEAITLYEQKWREQDYKDEARIFYGD